MENNSNHSHNCKNNSNFILEYYYQHMRKSLISLTANDRFSLDFSYKLRENENEKYNNNWSRISCITDIRAVSPN